MATRVTNMASQPQQAEISENDLKKMTDDFRDNVEITSVDGRVLNKTDTVTIPFIILDNFLSRARDLISNSDVPVLSTADMNRINIKIKFGITPSDLKDCSDEFLDISNRLTVVLTIEKDEIDLDFAAPPGAPTNVIITPGFKASCILPDGDGAVKVCCPGTGGKGGGTH
ncbi:hypothetical protein HGH93_12170 [Chitinophaga polysaccharea]|uniref:hypothetical protein n=1 Tax=Chitinophaga polysaccharea TaxID=1293035 RepID=UPI001455055F|nr:hypothetical protein [Chitinophaga polysaccharea]NLR58863.1 hypothetical protein [Chitinophaga polysaccharea]